MESNLVIPHPNESSSSTAGKRLSMKPEDWYTYSKRPRTHDGIVPNGEGAINGHQTSSPRQDRAKRLSHLQSTLSSKLRTALEENLTPYIKRLQMTEENIINLTKDSDQFSKRLKQIEVESKELARLVNERQASLPPPTDGVGSRRTLSSQAPRNPPPNNVPKSMLPNIVSKSDLTLATQAATKSSNEIQYQSLAVNFVAIPSSAPSSVPQSSNPIDALSAHNKMAKFHFGDTIDLTVDTPAIGQHAMPIAVQSVSSQPCIMQKQSTMGQSTTESYVDNQQLLAAPSSSQMQTSQLPGMAALTRLPRMQPAPMHYQMQQVSSLSSSLQPVTQKSFALAPSQRPGLPSRPLPSMSPGPSHLNGSLLFKDFPVAPLPLTPRRPPSIACRRRIQPTPQLSITEADEGVCLQWSISSLNDFEPAVSYDIYSYASCQLTNENRDTPLPWKKVGEVSALPLPMACTLTHVQSKNLYYFAVRSVDRYQRYSDWSNVVNAYVA